MFNYDTYAISNRVLDCDRISVVEAPDEVCATFLEDELQDPIRVEEVAKVRLVPVGLRECYCSILFISITLIGRLMFN